MCANQKEDRPEHWRENIEVNKSRKLDHTGSGGIKIR